MTDDPNAGFPLRRDTYVGRHRTVLIGNFVVTITKDKDTNRAYLIDKMFTAAAVEGLRRDSEYVYRPVPGKPCCYIADASHEKFIHRVFSGDQIYIAKSTNQAELERSLRNDADSRVPFIERDLGLIGVRNGLIHIEKTPRFTLFKDVDDRLRQRTARTFIDAELQLDDTLRICDNWNRLVRCQVSEEVQVFLMALMGRTLHKPDDHVVFLYLMGQTRTGKSTVVKLLQLFHGAQNVFNLNEDEATSSCLMGNNTLIVIPNMPLDINKTIAGKVMRRVVVSGDGTGIRKRMHLIATGNHYPFWTNAHNSIVPRMLIMEFDRPIQQQDKRVQKSILIDEAANILWSCLLRYADLLVQNPKLTSEDFLAHFPSYFNDQWKESYTCV